MAGLYQFLRQAREQHAERIAIVDGETRLTYAQVGARVEALAGGLASLGLSKGDRLGFIDRNSAEFFETYFAAAALGVALCPINTRLSPAEVAFILQDAGARRVICRRELRALLDRATNLDEAVIIGGDGEPGYEAMIRHGGGFIESELNTGSLAHLYYTSGTTGRPKGVMLTHGNVETHARAASDELALTGRDRWGHIAPMFHLADAWATFAVTLVGGRHVMLPAFEPRAALELMERERISVSNLVPTMLNLMLKHPERGDFPCASLRLLLSGGAPIARDLVRRIMRQFGCEYVQTYGMTETSPYLTLSKLLPHLRRLPEEEQLAYRARTGRPFSAVELKVVDEAGESVPADGQAVGEILARGPTVTPGYWRRPEETAAAFAEGGWLRTGDMATVESEGYLDIVDRKKDMILSGGENIFSIEVEGALYDHPAVLEAAVFGLADETWGERVAAAVVLRPGRHATADELREHARATLARYKTPREIHFLDELPKTGSGKITKKPLRERFQKNVK